MLISYSPSHDESSKDIFWTLMYSLQTSLKAKLKLSYFEHILRTQGSLKKGNNDGEKNRRQQEKKKIDYEVN